MEILKKYLEKLIKTLSSQQRNKEWTKNKEAYSLLPHRQLRNYMVLAPEGMNRQYFFTLF